MKFTDAQQALKLYQNGLNTETIAILLGVDRDEVEQAIQFAQEHQNAPYPYQTGDNDDWQKYETGA